MRKGPCTITTPLTQAAVCFHIQMINVLPMVHTCSFKPKRVVMEAMAVHLSQYAVPMTVFNYSPPYIFTSVTDGTKEAFLYNLLAYGRLLIIVLRSSELQQKNSSAVKTSTYNVQQQPISMPTQGL